MSIYEISSDYLPDRGRYPKALTILTATNGLDQVSCGMGTQAVEAVQAVEIERYGANGHNSACIYAFFQVRVLHWMWRAQNWGRDVTDTLFCGVMIPISGLSPKHHLRRLPIDDDSKDDKRPWIVQLGVSN